MHSALKHEICPIKSCLTQEGFCRFSPIVSDFISKWIPLGCDKLFCLVEDPGDPELISWETCLKLLEEANIEQEGKRKNFEATQKKVNEKVNKTKGLKKQEQKQQNKKRKWRLKRVCFEDEFGEEQILHYSVLSRLYMTKKDNQLVFSCDFVCHNQLLHLLSPPPLSNLSFPINDHARKNRGPFFFVSV